jgi:hypothetical protein
VGITHYRQFYKNLGHKFHQEFTANRLSCQSYQHFIQTNVAKFQDLLLLLILSDFFPVSIPISSLPICDDLDLRSKEQIKNGKYDDRQFG